MKVQAGELNTGVIGEWAYAVASGGVPEGARFQTTVC